VGALRVGAYLSKMLFPTPNFFADGLEARLRYDVEYVIYSGLIQFGRDRFESIVSLAEINLTLQEIESIRLTIGREIKEVYKHLGGK
jgi:hypothetical protein